MKITVKQLKQLIREQVEEGAARAAATQVLENSGFSGEVSEDGKITIFINYDLMRRAREWFSENGYTLTEKGTRPKSREIYLTFSPKE